MANILIREAAGCLSEVQKSERGIISLSSRNQNFDCFRTYLTTFSTSTILNCLDGLEVNLNISTLTIKIKEKSAKFLLSQKSPQWSFNYWARQSPEYKTLPYPDDADDTFTALAALTQYNPDLLDPSAMAKITQLLISIETEPGGPYRTWFVPATSAEVWRDVDLAPNSAIAYFLQLQKVRLPKLLAWLDGQILAGNFSSRYYPFEYPILYFLSRLDGLEHQQLIVERLKHHLQADESGESINMLEAGLTASALANGGAPASEIKPAVDMIEKQYALNHWQPFAFCLDPAINGQTHYHGSSALTAAIVLEALAKYQNLLERQRGRRQDNRGHEHGGQDSGNPDASHQGSFRPSEDSLHKTIRQKVTALADAACQKLDPPLRQQAQTVLAQMLKQDKSHSIILLPQLFRQALGRGNESRANASRGAAGRGAASASAASEQAFPLTDELMIRLGLAQLYGWCAFSTFDDVIDAQKSPSDLPAAMLFLEWFLDGYHTIADNYLANNLSAHRAAKQLVARYVQATTSAYAREISDYRIPVRDNIISIPARFLSIPTRFPNFKDATHLADRSLGHALAPIIILSLLGHKKDSAPVLATENFFRHYLAARQLHDDAHDWREDLAGGRITPVTALLMNSWRTNFNKTSIKLDIDLPQLHELFWNNLMGIVSQSIHARATQARAALSGAVLNDAAGATLDNLALPHGNSHQTNFLEHPELLTNLLIPLERGANQALTERDNIKLFMQNFSPKT